MFFLHNKNKFLLFTPKHFTQLNPPYMINKSVKI